MKWVYKLKSKSALSPEEMAQTYTWLATAPELNHTTGKYFNEKNRKFSLRLEYENFQIYTYIQIYDITGILLMIRPIMQNKTTIDLANYPAGIYLLHISDKYRNEIVKVLKK